MLMQKILVGIWVKKFTFAKVSLKFAKAKFLHYFFDTTLLCSYNSFFRVDTGNNRKIVNFTCSQETRKLEFEKWAKIPHRRQNQIL